MAKGSQGQVRRARTYKFPSVSVQGPSSYVEFGKPSWGEIRETVDEIREMTTKILSENRAEVKGGSFVPRGNLAGEVEDTLSGKLWEIAREKFISWNWIGDDEEPLPPLTEVLMDDLLGDEVEFIFSCVQILYKMTDDERSGK